MYNADKDKRGIYMFFNPSGIVATQGGFMKVFAHELMHLMYDKSTGDWDAGNHLIDPDGDGHLFNATTNAWVGDPSGPPHGPDVQDQRALMWQRSHVSQENLNTVTIYPKTQKVIMLKDNFGVNP